MTPVSYDATLNDLYDTIDNITSEHPLAKEQFVSSDTTEPVTTTKSTFGLTVPIRDLMDKLRPNTVIADYEEVFLSESEVQSLKPVPDRTMQSLLILLLKQPCEAVMLDGSLLAHTKYGQYIKIVPTIDKNGYASYRLLALNWNTLSKAIRNLESLLQSSTEYAYRIEGEIEEEPSKPEWQPLSLLDELNQHKSDYNEAKELFYSLSLTATNIFKGTDKTANVSYLARTKYYKTFYISGHYLSAWIYHTAEYDAKINNSPLDAQSKAIKYQVDHIKQGFEHRSDNRPENLCIESADYNKGRTCRSTKVSYQGKKYVSLSAYCDATDAGNTNNIHDLKNSLHPGDTKEYNNRIYTLIAEKQLTVTDAELKVPPILFNGEPFDSIEAFAKATNLSPEQR